MHEPNRLHGENIWKFDLPRRIHQWSKFVWIFKLFFACFLHVFYFNLNELITSLTNIYSRRTYIRTKWRMTLCLWPMDRCISSKLSYPNATKRTFNCLITTTNTTIYARSTNDLPTQLKCSPYMKYANVSTLHFLIRDRTWS